MQCCGSLVTLCTVSPADPPGRPRKLAVEEMTRKTCVLTWKEPENDGGSEILGYYVERIQGAHSTRWTPVNRTAVTACKLELRVSEPTPRAGFPSGLENMRRHFPMREMSRILSSQEN